MALIRSRMVLVLLGWLCLLFVTSTLFTACSRGESSGGAPQEASGEENTWEKMVWDQGKWG